MPLLDQTADPSGETINFGGVSTADTAGEDNAIAALQQVQAQYSVDPSRIYVTGNSLGGIGTEDMIIKYNAYTGTEGKIFAAGLSLAGADYGQGYPQPNASVVTALKNVPFMAIHGGQDTQVPLTRDQNLYAAEQAIGGDMIYPRPTPGTVSAASNGPAPPPRRSTRARANPIMVPASPWPTATGTRVSARCERATSRPARSTTCCGWNCRPTC
jgi:dienelactone hydrolase